MNAAQLDTALRNALKVEGVQFSTDEALPIGATITMTECQMYRAFRTLCHRMDKGASKWDIRRYGYKAVAGAMKALIERRGCDKAPTRDV